ncbi:MAG: septum formation protein Maf [Neisseriales bacterium]|nr:MAG: septum formation protein Maf [Neisseriales bacterium]
MQIVLASTSPARQRLLTQCHVLCNVASPKAEEVFLPTDPPKKTVLRLARLKAQSVAVDYPNTLIIGADQLAYCDQQLWGKPHSLHHAIAMLQKLSGHRLRFYTAFALLNTKTGQIHQYCETTDVVLRNLTLSRINYYLKQEPSALNCAGAIKAEGLGALLIRSIHPKKDPNALIGLPILTLFDYLEKAGWSILDT